MSTTAKREVTFTFNGQSFKGAEGQSIAAALMATGVRELRKTRFEEEPLIFYLRLRLAHTKSRRK